MNRKEAFKLKFKNEAFKIVAAGHEQPLDDVVLCYNNEVDILLERTDVILLSKMFNISAEDL